MSDTYILTVVGDDCDGFVRSRRRWVVCLKRGFVIRTHRLGSANFRLAESHVLSNFYQQRK